jgi:hypothetical protein
MYYLGFFGYVASANTVGAGAIPILMMELDEIGDFSVQRQLSYYVGTKFGMLIYKAAVTMGFHKSFNSAYVMGTCGDIQVSQPYIIIIQLFCNIKGNQCSSFGMVCEIVPVHIKAGDRNIEIDPFIPVPEGTSFGQVQRQ